METWSNTPAAMVDGDIALFTYTDTFTDGGDGEVQLLDANTCLGLESATIDTVELRVYGKEDIITTADKITLRPVFAAGDGDNHDFDVDIAEAWSGWMDITTDTNAPSPWTWDDVVMLCCDVVSSMTSNESNNRLSASKVEIKVSTLGTQQIELTETVDANDEVYPVSQFTVDILRYVESPNKFISMVVRVLADDKSTLENLLSYAGNVNLYNRPFDTVKREDISDGHRNIIRFNANNVPSGIENPFNLIIADYSSDFLTPIPTYVFMIRGFKWE
jgi:hypothetical protein